MEYQAIRRSAVLRAPDGRCVDAELVEQSCPACGHSAHRGGHRPIKRGALLARFGPTEIWWNDTKVPLSPTEAEIFGLLMRRGKASWEEIGSLFRSPDGSPDIRGVLLYRIRRKFSALGAADPLTTVRGWGLKLSWEEDGRNSRSTWIGGYEPD